MRKVSLFITEVRLTLLSIKVSLSLIIALVAIYVDGALHTYMLLEIPKPKLNSTAAKWGETRRDIPLTLRTLLVY